MFQGPHRKSRCINHIQLFSSTPSYSTLQNSAFIHLSSYILIVLFRCEKVNELTLYPWIHQFSNNKKSSDQTRPVRFPDVNPQSLPLNSDLSMVAGDFVEVYTESGKLKLWGLWYQWPVNDHRGTVDLSNILKRDPVKICDVFLVASWDCVATCFFIDTAHNVIEYVETIWKILKPGGVWINLGESVREYHLNSAGRQKHSSQLIFYINCEMWNTMVLQLFLS